MATSTGPDLTGAVAAVEALMDDTCQVTVNSDPRAWSLDPATLRLAPPADAVVYDGPCKLNDLGSMGGGSATLSEGGVQLAVARNTLDAPIGSCPVLAAGMVVHMTSSRRNAALVGQLFTVVEPVFKTMAVKRSHVVVRRARVEG